jgi:hypothetical protein
VELFDIHANPGAKRFDLDDHPHHRARRQTDIAFDSFTRQSLCITFQVISVDGKSSKYQNTMTPNESHESRSFLGLWREFIRRISNQRYGRFELRSNGVYGFSTGKKASDGEGAEPPSGEFVCAWLEVTAQSRNEAGEEWGYVLKWKDPDQREHTWSAPQSLIVRAGTKLAEALARGGLKIAPGKRSELPNYISSVNPSKRILNVPRTGGTPWRKAACSCSPSK